LSTTSASCSPRRLHCHHTDRDEQGRRPLLQPARNRGAVDQGGQDRDPLDAPLLSSLQSQRGAVAPRRHRLQPRQSAASAGSTRLHPGLVPHEPPAATVQDRRAFDPARSVLHLAAGGELLDRAIVSPDSPAYRAVGAASVTIEGATPAARPKASGTVAVDGAHERHRRGGVERRWRARTNRITGVHRPNQPSGGPGAASESGSREEDEAQIANPGLDVLARELCSGA